MSQLLCNLSSQLLFADRRFCRKYYRRLTTRHCWLQSTVVPSFAFCWQNFLTPSEDVWTILCDRPDQQSRCAALLLHVRHMSFVRILVLLITSSMFNRLIVEVLVGIYKRRRNREKPLARVDRFLHKTTRASDLVLFCVKSFPFSGLELTRLKTNELKF